MRLCIIRSEEHTSELQSHSHLVCRLLLEKKKTEDDGEPPGPLEHHPDASANEEDQRASSCYLVHFFFFNDTAPPEIYTLSLHDALPICRVSCHAAAVRPGLAGRGGSRPASPDRKSTRLDSSHISSRMTSSDLKNKN